VALVNSSDKYVTEQHASKRQLANKQTACRLAGISARVHDTRLICGPDFPVFTGIDLVAFEAMAVGADGWIAGIPMIAPRSAIKLHRLLTVDKDLDAARATRAAIVRCWPASAFSSVAIISN
jgi:dihydrodipicolinate synthase/N-acetylneuraminate lyase